MIRFQTFDEQHVTVSSTAARSLSSVVSVSKLSVSGLFTVQITLPAGLSDSALSFVFVPQCYM